MNLRLLKRLLRSVYIELNIFWVLLSLPLAVEQRYIMWMAA